MPELQITKAVQSQAEIALPDAHDFWLLMKPRVMSLAVFTALAGLMVAPGSLHPVLAFAAVLFTALGAGAAGALNMWFDADIDAKMARTRGRPVPTGRMDKGTALGFGLTLAVASVSLMALFVNWVAAALLAASVAFYVLVYTMWLKRRTPQNIVIGGAAGALPPVIGWAAVTGSVGVVPLLLFAVIFAWTPAHFWALALNCGRDYEKAALPMLPNVAGHEAARLQILIYAALTALVSLGPVVAGFSGVLYAAAATVLGASFVFQAFRLYRNRDEASARALFLFSIFYLFVLFLALIADSVVQGLA